MHRSLADGDGRRRRSSDHTAVGDVDARRTRHIVLRPDRSRMTGWLVWTAAVTVAFVQPLARLVSHAAQNELSSYIPLMPFVAGYLLAIQPMRDAPQRSSLGGALAVGAVGVASLSAAITWHDALSVNDSLALTTSAYLAFVIAGAFLFLGSAWVADSAFPIGLSLFMIPIPDAAVTWIETQSVRASADVAAALFRMTGTPLLRDGTQFALPGIVLKVAQECSGIRSSWVLLITSLVASRLLIDSPWRRLALVAFVVPLGVIRNGFRILVIGLLCVYVGPHMIDSPIHHNGGPLFFVLSLAPLFAFLIALERPERRRRRRSAAASPQHPQ